MKMKWLFSMLFLLMAGIAVAQSPAVDLALIVTDNASGKQELRFGLDPTATDSLDAHLSEKELPPFPPPGVFEARFVGEDISLPGLGQGTYRDYRTGGADFVGTHVHELRYQVGDSGDTITISWDLPNGITGLLQDLLSGVVVNKEMSGRDSLVVTNPGALNKLKMTITYKLPTAIEYSDDTIPMDFSLSQNYPNPFNPETTISFALPRQTHVVLKVYNILGKEVHTLIDDVRPAGVHKVVWNGRDKQGQVLPSGIYIYKIKAGEFAAVRKMSFVR